MKTIFQLLVFIFVILLVGLLFETHIETYKNQYSIGRGVGTGIIGHELNYTYITPKNSDKFGNLRYPGKAFLNVADGKHEVIF